MVRIPSAGIGVLGMVGDVGIPPASWWQADGALRRFVGSLVIGELARQRGGAGPVGLPLGGWCDQLCLDETGLGADSLERVRLAAALADGLEMVRDGCGDRLLVSRRFGEWLEIARGRLAMGDGRLRFYSSGSTGVRSGTVHTLSTLEEEARFLASLMPGRRRILAAVPCHHIYGFLFTILLPRWLGAAEALPVVDLRDDSPPALAGLWQPGDLVVAYPEYWRDAVAAGRPAPPDVVGVTSTAPCPAEVAIAVAGCGVRLIEVFGATETGGLGWRTDADVPFRWFPYWRWDGGDTLTRVLDGGEHRLLPVPDVLEPAPCGGFRPAGRRDTVVQVGGVNVSLAGVAAVLLRHPWVTAASVRLMRPEEGSRLKAFIVPAAAAPPAAELARTLMAWSEQVLPAPSRPRAFSFGPRLPTTLLGKVADWSIDSTLLGE